MQDVSSLTARLPPSVRNDEALMPSDRGPLSAADLSKEKVILSIDGNFIVLNKPHDLRMDGDFDFTVQKLLLEWMHYSLSELKWVHQLDFATSGALAVARTKEMAGYASNSFEFRETHKEYLAIVEGHVNYNQWPEAKEEANKKETDQKEENDHEDSQKEASKSRRRARPPQPKEHEAARENNVKLYFDALQLALSDASSSPPVHGQQKQAELEEMGQVPLSEYLSPSNQKLRKRLRKALRGTEYLAKMEEDLGSSIVTAQPSKKRKKEDRDSNTNEPQYNNNHDMVRVLHHVPDGSQHTIERVTVGGKEAIRINAAIAEVKDDFRMELGHTGNPGRAGQTTLFVLLHTFYQGRPVTKVLMHPKSGRRHQLRLHTRAMGHPIVGDITYGSEHATDAERMMLHSYKLMIPIPRRRWRGQEGPPPKLVDCEAPAYFSTTCHELNGGA